MTQNRIVRPIIAGNILCAFDQEALSDSNVIADAQLYQQHNTLSNSSPNCFNLQSPTVDVDADGSLYTDESITGTFAFTARHAIDVYCDGRLMQAANLRLNFPAASQPGDIIAAESTTVGKIYLGTSNVSFSTGAGVPSGACTTGSLYTDSTASGASTVLYVCATGTWNPK